MSNLYLQISAIRLDIREMQVIDMFNSYCLATKPIPDEASKVHNIFLLDGVMKKKENDASEFVVLDALPLRIVLQNFLQWIFSHDGDELKHKLLLGFNNFALDDYLIIHHIRDKCEDVQITDVRRTLFSSDLKSIMKSKTSLTNEAETLKISTEGAHDGLEDCKLIIDVMTRKSITIDQVKHCSRSFESVINKRTNPLLRSGLISQTVADKLPLQISHGKWLGMTDQQIREVLETNGVKDISIKACLAKRRIYKT